MLSGWALAWNLLAKFKCPFLKWMLLWLIVTPKLSHLSYARPVSWFAGNWAEIFFSDRMDAISVGSQELSVIDEHEINPVGFCVKMGGFWHFLASGVSCTQGKKSDWIYLMYTSANLLVNIFNKSGWALREIQGVHGFSSCTVT